MMASRTRSIFNEIITLLIIFPLYACNAVGEETKQENFIESTPIPYSGWHPKPGTSFQIQFSGEIDLSVDAQVFDLDAFETSKEMVTELHQADKKVICYINAGAVENWRPDIDQFPQQVIGKDYSGWPGENWLDIRQIDLLEPVLTERIAMCAEKGFDGIEFDNLDGYQNDTGFDISAEDQLTYNRWLADLAHSYDLAVGLKNDPNQIAALEPWFDFSILESCFEQGWCEMSSPFVNAGKAVFDIEYSKINHWCTEASEKRITLIGKELELNADLNTCQ